MQPVGLVINGAERGKQKARCPMGLRGTCSLITTN